MTAYRVHECASVAQLRESLGQAGRSAAPEDLFYTLEWFENLERHGIPAGERVRALRVERAGAGGAMCLPFVRRERGHAATWGPVLGGLSNFYSSLFGPAGHAGACTTEACRAALRRLRRGPDRAGVLDIQPLDQESPFFAHLQQALVDEGFLTDRYFCFGNWHLDVGARAFDAYFETVPSRIRNTIRRGRKKIDETPGSSLRIVTGSDADLEQAIADFDIVYRRSWKVPEPFPEFVPNLIRTAAACGWLRLGVVRIGDLPIAAQLWLVRDGRALIYKLAYDEDHKRYSAGSVLTAELMRHVIDVDRVHDVDYLTGDDSYKADWMSLRRERVGLVAFDPRTLQGLASAARHFGGKWWRRLRAAQAPAGASVTDPASAPAVPSPEHA